jgi:hypothetical protein
MQAYDERGSVNGSWHAMQPLQLPAGSTVRMPVLVTVCCWPVCDCINPVCAMTITASGEHVSRLRSPQTRLQSTTN